MSLRKYGNFGNYNFSRPNLTSLNLIKLEMRSPLCSLIVGKKIYFKVLKVLKVHIETQVSTAHIFLVIFTSSISLEIVRFYDKINTITFEWLIEKSDVSLLDLWLMIKIFLYFYIKDGNVNGLINVLVAFKRY